MKKLLMFIFLVVSMTMTGQQTMDWLGLLNNPKEDIDKLRIENVKADYYKFDFSTLFVPRHEFLGYIGSNYRRIRINFTSIVKRPDTTGTYDIKGISLVGANKCDFTGEISIDQIREYKSMHYGVDDIYKSRGIVRQGLLIGKYEFKENSNLSESGVFSGVMTLFWYLDRHGIIQYDDIEFGCSDRYCNNQYVGTWIKYGSDKNKICNWGELRIPFSGALDIGTGEFSPYPKYIKMGWEDMVINVPDNNHN